MNIRELTESVEKSTADCKMFLADFFKETPDLITQIFAGDPVGQEALTIKPKNWKRRSKGIPGGVNSNLRGAAYNVWEKGKAYPRGPSYGRNTDLKSSEVKNERVFILSEEKYENSIVFLVLETHEGKLYMGEYLGD